MKTFDEIYEELQNADNNELNNLWKEAKKEKDKANNISKTICLTIDIFAIIIFFSNGISFRSIFSIMPQLVTLLIINLLVVVIVNLLFSKNTNNYNIKFKQIVIKK